MNKQDEMILQLIKNNTFITEEELVRKTGITPLKVNEVILSLVQSGQIIGRSFVLPEEKQTLCIGGANVDWKIQTLKSLSYKTSNPSKSSKSCGGVARNIAENLGRLGSKTSLLSFVGSDSEGEWVLKHTKEFVDVSATQTIQGKSTGTYTAVLDTDGEMAVALADMAIYDEVGESCIDFILQQVTESRMVLLDTNLPVNINQQIIRCCNDKKIPLCIATVSAPKIDRLPDSLEGVSWLIANQKEAEALSGFEIRTEGDFFRAAEAILKSGVERVVITRGDKGLIYFTKKGEAGVLLPPEILITDVTGAGDSLVSGIIFSFLKGLGTVDACKVGISCSIITLQSNETVNPSFNQQKLMETFQTFFSKGVFQ
ncbi:MAG: carbohydrate kinase family protein [Bacillota bacterium]|nr:carbohydrate kinase family protein [Bacillota bacterium]